jgi:hypothetical protein
MCCQSYFFGKISAKKNVNSIATYNRKLLKCWTTKGILLTLEVGIAFCKCEIFSIKQVEECGDLLIEEE